MDDITELRVSALCLPQGEPEDFEDSPLLFPSLLALVDQDRRSNDARRGETPL